MANRKEQGPPKRELTSEEIFNKEYGSYRHDWVATNEDGSTKIVEAYIFGVDTFDKANLKKFTIDFIRHASQAGYKEAFSPLIFESRTSTKESAEPKMVT